MGPLGARVAALARAATPGVRRTVDDPVLGHHRTGGDHRVSNFLLWQLAYTELWFTDVLWPDLDAPLLQRALDDYAQRERRFGLTSAQVAGGATEKLPA